MDEPELLNKGIPDRKGGSALGWNVFDPDVPLPCALLLSDAVDHNVAAMADYCRDNGVLLAPHGKTTMSPELIGRQIAAGAWAITVATAWQAARVLEMGAGRIVIANEVTDPGSLGLLDRLLRDYPDRDIYCYVDSLDGLSLLEDGLSGPSRDRLLLLLELGIDGGRSGIRPSGDPLELGRRVAAGSIRLAGVAAFEGLIADGSIEHTLALVDRLLNRCISLAQALSAGGLISVDEPILTVGGSAYFDRVVALVPAALAGTGWRTVLRSGCYVTHDSGTYEQLSPLAGRGGIGARRLRPALQVIAAVLSRPEKGRAIIGLGRRDASSDAGLPVPMLVRSANGALQPVGDGWAVVTVNDQHAYLDLPDSADLRVGQLLVFGISHPCTTFDKWRVLPLVDPDYQVIELAHTRF